MKDSTLNFKVQYADTDAYGVAWHGSYLRWMEAGRIDVLYKNNIDIKKLDEENGIKMPVIELNVKYKKSAKLMDDVVVKTKVLEKTSFYVVFEQIVQSVGGETFIEGTVKGVCVKNGKILRSLEEIFKG